ncbi:MAG: membrane protein insertion efficiency factor YidD [Burkholderiaceae bacterium]
MNGIARLTSSALLGSIATYRLVVSPWLPARCRFEPSCSAYASEAIRLHGPAKGSRLAVTRLARCHPWHTGGYDPVPLSSNAATPDALPTDTRPDAGRCA